MTTLAASSQRSATRAWEQRGRSALVILIAWALLRYVFQPLALDPGLDRPLVLLSRFGGLLTAVTFAACLLASVAAARAILGATPARALLLVSAAVAIYLWPTGTMDHWLIMSRPVPGPPSAAPYAALLPEYLLLALLAAAAAVLCRVVPLTPATLRDPAALRERVTALVVSAAVAAPIVMTACGERFGQTLRGQVYFAVALAFYAGVLVAIRVTGVRSPAWYWPAPLLVGLAGVTWAMLRPAPAGVYAANDLLPPNGLVRPLPLEMVFVGLWGAMLPLRRIAAGGTAEPAASRGG